VTGEPSLSEPRRLRVTCTAVAVAAAAFALVIGIRWGALAVGGSDSHCYAGQARMFSEGRASLPPPMALPVSWPNAAATFAPSGFAPGPGVSGASVPLCPAGLSILMLAAQTLAGDRAIFLIVPLMGALAVWSTFLLGRRLAGVATGAASALLIACSPTFLYQLVQPMSDVPAAALWTASLAAALGIGSESRHGTRTAVVSGLLAGAAIMMRPNLAPLAAIAAVLALPSRRAVAGATCGVLPGAAAVAVLQAAIYGSPLRSGYGSLGQLFSASHVAANLVNYPSWLALAHTPALALAVVAPVVVRRRGAAWAMLSFAAAVLALYAAYVPFTDWWYSRFMLPALPALVVLMVAVVERAASRLPLRAAAVTLAVLTVALAGLWLHRAQELSVFRVKALEQKYVELGRLAARRLPARAIVLAAQPAGSVRYYSRLPTLSWDAVDPAWLDRVIGECRSRGLTPYLAIESWEMDAFRSRFRGHSTVAELDWPPLAALGRVIFVFDPLDRARYLAGENVQTERITWNAR
jgi:hypothetical protein